MIIKLKIQNELLILNHVIIYWIESDFGNEFLKDKNILLQY